MLLNENTLITFHNKSVVIAKALVMVKDLCFQYNINASDKEFASDIQKLCQHAIVTQIISTVTQSSSYVMFVSTGSLSKSLLKPQDKMAITYIVATYNQMSRLIRHRFIVCGNCIIPKITQTVESLEGELKDVVLIAATKANSNYSRIKKFVTRNRLTELQLKFENNFPVAKLLFFL